MYICIYKLHRLSLNLPLLLTFGGVGLMVCGVFLIINLLTVGKTEAGFLTGGCSGVSSTARRLERSILSLDAVVSEALVGVNFVGVVVVYRKMISFSY